MSEIAKPIPDTRVDPKSDAPVGGAIKRLIDIILSAVAIGLMLPLLVLCAFATFLASGRPIIARHPRIGFRGRAFECFGFETSAETRVTRLGAVLRKAGLDDLPQLFNVLRGDMSIVGPQPISCDRVRPVRRSGSGLSVVQAGHYRALASATARRAFSIA